MNHHETYPGHDYDPTGVDTNKLRAAVLGANDGIVSVASIAVGVAAATTSSSQILIAGIAGLVAGAFSMAVGEYVSVSSQRDTEHVLLEGERRLLDRFPQEELEELAHIYQKKGLSESTARKVAAELTANDAHAAHFEAELGIDPDELTNPWHAAWASMLAFTVGGLVPLLVIVASTPRMRIIATFAAVVLSLTATGYLSGRASGASKRRAALRVVVGGIIAMFMTYLIGHLVKVSMI